MSDLLILLPPSESKATGGSGLPWHRRRHAHPTLARQRAFVAQALQETLRTQVVDPELIFGVGGLHLDRAVRAGLTLDTAGTKAAVQRYTGVLYGALDWPSLDVEERRRGDASVRIVSGLWGLVAPRDQIPDYRLKMSAALPGLGTLSRWWKPSLTAVIGQVAAGRVVWDLLPIEHAAAWDPIGVERTTVSFLAEGKAVSHWSKLLKGAFTRHLLCGGAAESFTHASGLGTFVHDPARSTAGRVCFSAD